MDTRGMTPGELRSARAAFGRLDRRRDTADAEGLSRAAFGLLWCLLRPGSFRAWPGDRQAIAERSRRSVRFVRRHLPELLGLGYVELLPARGDGPPVYRLTPKGKGYQPKGGA
jgi:hypothetical protein